MRHTPGPYQASPDYKLGLEIFDDKLEKVRILGPEKDNGWQTVLAEMSINTTELETLETAKLFAASPELLRALEEIAKKAPMNVSREEAADMACEFWIVANEAIKKFRGGK